MPPKITKKKLEDLRARGVDVRKKEPPRVKEPEKEPAQPTVDMQKVIENQQNLTNAVSEMQEAATEQILEVNKAQNEALDKLVADLKELMRKERIKGMKVIRKGKLIDEIFGERCERHRQ